ncbi:hypothetical protein POSPLADRAFT_1154849 [Postia placenta MAD-698-R-SB12]|uniref:DUF6535 domain-containing protein n=1 Tax=Postia placenta MAD-698-R-SB12 TaxID=670580 RepID=A0A1X6MN57_9APHY|nr:hypothetical protein POSPLADRAFT_1154849 [Postia placenta MAD-698-R-SB12]OSX57854.1 hypothetical protein POSPLADRAFT_1154849 [Postia placenta MAD-698-R-SB12]
MTGRRRRSGSRKSRSRSNGRSGNAEALGPTLTTRARASERMGESIPLKEIKVVNRDGELSRGADATSVPGQQEVCEAMLPRQAVENGNTTQGMENGDNGEVSKAEGMVPGPDSLLTTHAPSDNNDPGKIAADGKLNEELVRKVLQDALEAKRKPEDPWAKCAKEVWEFEESLVQKWKEEINNLLLFSGLFSTVLTGFIVPFYVTLAVTQTLISMSGQLSVVAADAGHATIAKWLIKLSAHSQSSSGPSSTIVAVAVLWFAALILSLGAASIALSIGQWLHHHINGASKTSQRSVRVWSFRRRGLTRWGVEQAVAVLPLLLQFALVLFLLGVDILLWTISTVVAGVATALIILLLVPTIATSVIPSFSPDCPYKSAQAWWFFLFWRWAMQWLEKANLFAEAEGREYVLRKIWNCCCQENWRIIRDLPPLSGWRQLDNFCMQTLEDDVEKKLNMLVKADACVMDETFLSTVVQPCLQQAGVLEALPAFYEILDHRAHDRHQNKAPEWWPEEQDHQAVHTLGLMSLGMYDKIVSVGMGDKERKENIGHIFERVGNLLYAMPSTMPAVYNRLMDMWEDTGLADNIRVHIAPLVVEYYSRFNDGNRIDTNSVRKMFDLLPTANEELSIRQFLRYFWFASKNAANLSPSDLAQVREAIQQALVAVEGCFSPNNIKFESQEGGQARTWLNVADTCQACARLAEYDASLFTKAFIDALAGCAARCPRNNVYDDIHSHIKKIRNLFNTLHENR